MGCYSIQGCISQLPIHDGDRVAGIFCKIGTSLNYSNILTNISYTLEPMCPIIYGTYNDYGGLKPDDSKTKEILETFFENSIDSIISAFVYMTEGCYVYDDMCDILKPLIEKRDTNKIRTIKVYHTNQDDFFNSIEHILPNNWCLLLEHEDIIKTIINHHSDLMISRNSFDKIPYIDWNELYDIQLNICKENNLDNWYNTDINFELAYEFTTKYQDILFPVNQYTNFRGVYSNNSTMDLFQNYPDMFHFAFDSDLKNEYLDTLKFYNVVKESHINMIINHDTGHQWQNINLWKNLVTVYNEIITPKEHSNY